MAIFVFSVLFALGLSAICSLLEATLLSYTSSQVAALEARRPRTGRSWRRFKDNVEKPIAVILVLNTTAHTVGATLAGSQSEKIFTFQGGVLVFSGIFTYLMLQFTEILPKTLGVRYNAALAPFIAAPLDLLIRVMAPVLWFIQLVNRLFQPPGERRGHYAAGDRALAASAPLMDPHLARMIRAASEMERSVSGRS